MFELWSRVKKFETLRLIGLMSILTASLSLLSNIFCSSYVAILHRVITKVVICG